ncbi:hypothetical protein [Sandaracinus amylolyticus]|uniref:hypothetical protein n=1 Tax=Sandaracinus amylolyticus TaxID=927083 RepID=UPI001F360422|nr:hypothetical protein [Sandaracinus amylolyticus]UJR86407.1 Hypothetical protein I5071_85020 [Sandaracinus amylolyticus]
MQWGRFAVWGVIATVAVGGVALAADALVESDEEQIAEIADALTGPRIERRVDAVLAHVDSARAPVTVRADGWGNEFGEDDEDPADAIRDALSPLTEGDLELVQRSVDVEGDRARVALRVRTGEGAIVDAQLALRRDGQSWLIDSVRRL